jgi:hypothetical protein
MSRMLPTSADERPSSVSATAQRSRMSVSSLNRCSGWLYRSQSRTARLSVSSPASWPETIHAGTFGHPHCILGCVQFTVWVQNWQHECCGTPFSVGSTVHWTLAEPEREYVDSLFHPDLSVEIDYAEDRHMVLADEDAPDTVGTVTAIRSVQVRYAPAPDDPKELSPVPGSAALTEVDRSNGDEMRSGDFAGYLVEILVPDGDQPAAGP